MLCLIPPVLGKPSLLFFAPLLLVLVLVNVWHTIHKSERAMLNNCCAILVFSVGGAAAYLLGGGGWDQVMVLVTVFSFLHFMGSVFFVKAVFRERKNPRWIIYAKAYHLLVLIVPVAVGYPWMTLSYIYSTARTFVYAGKMLKPWKVGIIEIIGAVQFLLLSIWLFN